MTKTMNNGTENLINLDELSGKLDLILEEYEQCHGIKFPQRNIENYLKLTRDEISKLDYDSCLEIAYELSCQSIYIQSVYNKENGRVKWANAMISSYCCTDWKNYTQFFKDEMKIAAISKENSAVNKLLKIRNNAEQRKERLQGISNNLKYLSSIFIESSKSKRYAQHQ